MDIFEKANLIIGNILISNQGLGHNDEIDLVIFNEIREELVKKVDELIDPIIDEYKKHVKQQYYYKFKIKENIELQNDLLAFNLRNRSDIKNYIIALDDINQRIKEIQNKINSKSKTS